MNPDGWVARAALATALVVVTLSVIIVVTGLPYSETIATCSPGHPCTSTQQVGTDPAPLLAVTILLFLGLASAVGLGIGRMSLAWSGAIPLLFFSILTGFSIGLLYLPIDATLIGLLAIVQSRQPPQLKNNRK
jgi:hypothetical protein